MTIICNSSATRSKSVATNKEIPEGVILRKQKEEDRRENKGI